MSNHVTVILLECWWLPGSYAAFQSTPDNYTLDVYLKRARTIAKALTTTTRWAKQSYQMPWVDLIRSWYQTHSGAEIVLWTNDNPRERGIKMAMRFLNVPMKWIYATIQVPGMTPAKMQLIYLEWGCRFFEYASDTRSAMYRTWDQNSVWPFVYPPSGTPISEVREWVVNRARDEGYEDRLPFIMKVIDYFVDHRWQLDQRTPSEIQFNDWQELGVR